MPPKRAGQDPAQREAMRQEFLKSPEAEIWKKMHEFVLKEPEDVGFLPDPSMIPDLTDEWEPYLTMLLDFSRQMKAVKMTGKTATQQ